MTLPAPVKTTIPFWSVVLAFLAAHASLVRGIEAFVLVVLAQFAANVAAFGSPPDLTTALGWHQLVVAFGAAILFALNSWRLTSGKS